MKRINSLPDNLIKNLINEFNKNIKLRNQINLFKRSDNQYNNKLVKKDFNELSLPPFYGFNSFNKKTTDYELPIFLINGLEKLGLIKKQINNKEVLIKKINNLFGFNEYFEIFNYKNSNESFTCLINGNIYSSDELKSDKLINN